MAEVDTGLIEHWKGIEKQQHELTAKVLAPGNAQTTLKAWTPHHSIEGNPGLLFVRPNPSELDATRNLIGKFFDTNIEPYKGFSMYFDDREKGKVTSKYEEAMMRVEDILITMM